MLAFPSAQVGAFFKTDDSLERPDAQVHFAPAAGKYNDRGIMVPQPGSTASVCYLRPSSRGSVHIQSDRHDQHPQIRAKSRFYSAWARGDVVSVSMVPLASAGAGAVVVNGYSAEDGWEVTGLDWETGKTVSRTVFGHNNKGNGAYAILQFLENGDMLFDSVIGPYRISLD